MQSFRRIAQKLPSGRYRARYWDPTLERWVSPDGQSFRTKAEANRWIDEAVAAAQSSRPAPAKEKRQMPFWAFGDQIFWPDQQIRPNTRSQQLSIYRNHVLPHWRQFQLEEIIREFVDAWRADLFPKGEKPRPVKRQAYVIFHKIVMDALDRGYITASPFPAKPKIPKTAKKKPERALEAHEVERLAKSIDARYRALVYLLAYGGFRISEATALRVDDIDWKHNEISVDEALIVDAGRTYFDPFLKGERSHRSVPIPAPVMEILAQHLFSFLPPSPAGEELLFRGPRGAVTRRDLFQKRQFEPALKAACIARLTPHDLRHTAASAWFDEGFDIVEVARMLGDTVEVTEQTYVHLYRGRRSQKMVGMDQRVETGRATDANVVPLRRPSSPVASRRTGAT